MFWVRNSRILDRVIVLGLALLISNALALSCAMAYALCTDCPEHEALPCFDSCATAEAAISDTTPDQKADGFKPVALPRTAATITCAADPHQGRSFGRSPPDPAASPPLHLQFCVFLK